MTRMNTASDPEAPATTPGETATPESPSEAESAYDLEAAPAPGTEVKPDADTVVDAITDDEAWRQNYADLYDDVQDPRTALVLETMRFATRLPQRTRSYAPESHAPCSFRLSPPRIRVDHLAANIL